MNRWHLLALILQNSILADNLTDEFYEMVVISRVARFFLVQNTKTGKIYQITTSYTKCP
jgi:hypothetical protein